MSVETNAFWAYFDKGKLQNSSQHKTWCKACVNNHLEQGKEELEARIRNENEATKQRERKAARDEAHKQIGSLHGEKTVLITHILGSQKGKGSSGSFFTAFTFTYINPALTPGSPSQPLCRWDQFQYLLLSVSRVETIAPQAKTKAQRQRDGKAKDGPATHSNKMMALKRQLSAASSESPDTSSTEPAPRKLKQASLKVCSALEMLFSKAEIEAIQTQALHAQVSSKSKETIFKAPEMLRLMGMLRKDTIQIIPTANVLGGWLLIDAAARIEKKVEVILKEQELGMLTNQWKNIRKNQIAAVCVNHDYKLYTIDLLKVTAESKDGDTQCAQFERMIDRVENVYNCKVLFFVMDDNGGSKKGHVELGKKCPYLILPLCCQIQVPNSGANTLFSFSSNLVTTSKSICLGHQFVKTPPFSLVG
ncbi:hypothetical protein D9758_014739 [Tetrapyrgos nigripes]|uniref:Uncharacterized protein n=1 Tax=Tetrapyrgos nigripes TaxID=182062 RepID=A0A8H5CGR4_9AGAR|nr:hypothetical protein D9758_014739 [Tetrapyrgos nigripes]